MNLRALLMFTIVTIWCSSTLGGSPTTNDSTSGSRAEPKLSGNAVFTCGNTTREFIDEINARLESVPSGFGFTGSAFDICNGVHHKAIFTVPTDYDYLDAGFIFATKNLDVKAYWMFVFMNDQEITSDVFQNTNLVHVKDNEVISIPIKIPRGEVPVSSISVLGIDAALLKSDAARQNNFFVSTSIITSEHDSEVFSPLYVNANMSEYDPSPEFISYSTDHNSKNEMTEFVFSIDGEYEHLNVVAIDFRRGKRLPISCGEDNPGILTIKGGSDSGAASILCQLPPGLIPNDTVLAITSDYFISDSENYGAFNTAFTRMLRTH